MIIGKRSLPSSTLRYSSAASMGENTGEFIDVVGARQNNLKGIISSCPWTS